MKGLHPVGQALIATSFTWAVTALGAAGVFGREESSRSYIEEVVPESQLGGHTHGATLGGMLGFATMMVLDVALG
ncbi:MAG: hypothetical protein AB1449_09475 [Chloroflexota bacterium]